MINLPEELKQFIQQNNLQEVKKFYFYNVADEIKILSPAHHQTDGHTDVEIVAFLAETGAVDLSQWTYIDTAIPEYDTRWEPANYKFNKETKTIYPDLVLVREEVKARLRLEREPLLATLDVEFQRALEIGVDFSKIVAEKTRLRAITSAVDTMENFDELFNFHC